MLLLMHSKHPFPLFLRVTNANPKNKLGGGEEGGFLGRETNVILKPKNGENKLNVWESGRKRKQKEEKRIQKKSNQTFLNQQRDKVRMPTQKRGW